MSKPRCRVLLIDPDASFQEKLESTLREGFDIWATGDPSPAVLSERLHGLPSVCER